MKEVFRRRVFWEGGRGGRERKLGKGWWRRRRFRVIVETRNWKIVRVTGDTGW